MEHYICSRKRLMPPHYKEETDGYKDASCERKSGSLLSWRKADLHCRAQLPRKPIFSPSVCGAVVYGRTYILSKAHIKNDLSLESLIFARLARQLAVRSSRNLWRKRRLIPPMSLSEGKYLILECSDAVFYWTRQVDHVGT